MSTSLGNDSIHFVAPCAECDFHCRDSDRFFSWKTAHNGAAPLCELAISRNAQNRPSELLRTAMVGRRRRRARPTLQQIGCIKFPLHVKPRGACTHNCIRDRTQKKRIRTYRETTDIRRVLSGRNLTRGALMVYGAKEKQTLTHSSKAHFGRCAEQRDIHKSVGSYDFLRTH